MLWEGRRPSVWVGDDTTTAAGIDRRTAARRGCTRWLLGHGDITPAAWLQELVAAASEPDLDRYGGGGEVEALEREVAELLGKEAAVFMPSGVMAQQAVMRSWVERSTTDAVAVHGLSHLVLHELDVLSELHHLRVQHLTHDPRPATAVDLDALPGPLAAVSIELPLRDAGLVAHLGRAGCLHRQEPRTWRAGAFRRGTALGEPAVL